MATKDIENWPLSATLALVIYASLRENPSEYPPTKKTLYH